MNEFSVYTFDEKAEIINSSDFQINKSINKLTD